MKVLPVYPRCPSSFWGFQYALEFVDKKVSITPTGLATVAAMLPTDRFQIMPIADLNIRPLSDQQIKDADILFTSSMIVQRNSLEEIIDRAHFFGKKVVAGGPYPTSYRDLRADYLVLDEAEVTLPFFIKDLLAGTAKPVYDAETVLKLPHNLLLTPLGKPLLTQTPIPRWDLVDLSAYSSLAIQYSRGCPFNCDFCDITKLFGRESRTKDPEQMIRELNAIYTTGWRGSIFIVDDNFIGNKKEVRKFIPVLLDWQKRHNFPYTFFTETSVDLALPANRDVLDGMVASGFTMVFNGLESNDPTVLKKMHKQQNLGSINLAEKVRIIQEAGLEVTGGFILGNDGESPNVFDNIYDFIQSSGIVVPMAGLLTALKGTPLYERLELEGRLRNESSGNNTSMLGFNFKPELDEQFLINGYRDFMRRLFTSKNYYDRCRVLDERQGPHLKERSVDKSGLKALARIVYTNLLKRPDKEFFRYLAEVALTRPTRLPEAVTRGVKLHHFKVMIEGESAVVQYRQRAEDLYASFSSKVSKLKGNTEQRLAGLMNAERSILKKARRNYTQIHADFRQNADDILVKLTERVETYKHQYIKSLGSSAV